MKEKNYKYISHVAVAFVVVLIVSNIVSTKIINLGSFSFDGGTLLFPLSYIFGDILTEVYGYRQTRKIIWLGFWSLIFTSIIIMIISFLPSSSSWNYQTDYNNILGVAPRIIIASIVAYFIGEFLNSYIFAKIKIKTLGSMLWLRAISSTLVGQLFDSVVFVLVAFYGVFENSLVINIIISNYIFKVLIEVVFLPFTYYITKKLKKLENEDFYDTNTNFNPFL